MSAAPADVAGTLRAAPLFASIGAAADLQFLERRAVSVRLPRDAAVLRQGQRVDAISIIVGGGVKVCFGDSPVESLRLRPGSLFGEMEFFQPLPAQATVITVEDTELLQVPHAPLRRVVGDNPRTGAQLYRGFLATLIEKHSAVTQALVEWKLDNAAQQAAHDLRAPLAALKALAASLACLPSCDRALFAQVVERMDRIAHSLLTPPPPPAAAAPPVAARGELLTRLRALVAEKQARYRGSRQVTIAFVEAGASTSLGQRPELGATPATGSVACEAGELMRIASNLLDNAVDALGAAGGRAELMVRGQEDGGLQLTVTDDGVGMPTAVRRRLGRDRVSWGKQSGHGIAILHASRAVRAWGGRMRFYDRPDGGTVAHVALRACDVAAAVAPRPAVGAVGPP